MKLVELLEVYNTSCNIRLEDYNTFATIGLYDGKDSIEPKYNDCDVEFIQPWDSKTLQVSIIVEE